MLHVILEGGVCSCIAFAVAHQYLLQLPEGLSNPHALQPCSNLHHQAHFFAFTCAPQDDKTNAVQPYSWGPLAWGVCVYTDRGAKARGRLFLTKQQALDAKKHGKTKPGQVGNKPPRVALLPAMMPFFALCFHACWYMWCCCCVHYSPPILMAAHGTFLHRLRSCPRPATSARASTSSRPVSSVALPTARSKQKTGLLGTPWTATGCLGNDHSAQIPAVTSCAPCSIVCYPVVCYSKREYRLLHLNIDLCAGMLRSASRT